MDVLDGRSEKQLQRRLANVRWQALIADLHAENARALAGTTHEAHPSRRARDRLTGPDVGASRTDPDAAPAPWVLRALDRTDTPVVLLASDGSMEFGNRAFLDWRHQLHERPADGEHDYISLLASCAISDQGPDQDAAEAEAVRDVAAGRRPACVVELTHGPPHRSRVHLISARHLPEGGAIVTHAEVTNVVRLRRLFERRAQHDSLTDLLVHRAFRQEGERVTRKAVAQGRSVAVLMIDLDDFKAINDTHGHGLGDAVLIAAARRLRRSLRDEDLAGRLGGDEFGVVSCDVADTDELCARLRRALEAPVTFAGTVVGVHISVGVASGPTDGRTLDDLFRVADQRMYRDKRDVDRGTRAPDPNA